MPSKHQPAPHVKKHAPKRKKTSIRSSRGREVSTETLATPPSSDDRKLGLVPTVSLVRLQLPAGQMSVKLPSINDENKLSVCSSKTICNVCDSPIHLDDLFVSCYFCNEHSHQKCSDLSKTAVIAHMRNSKKLLYRCGCDERENDNTANNGNVCNTVDPQLPPVPSFGEHILHSAPQFAQISDFYHDCSEHIFFSNSRDTPPITPDFGSFDMNLQSAFYRSWFSHGNGVKHKAPPFPGVETFNVLISALESGNSVDFCEIIRK